jgi:hypothetical protein
LQTQTTEACFKLGRTWRTILETLLYRPVKTFLEGLGFVVKGEVGGCDLLALRADDPPIVVIGELKLTFNLELQFVQRNHEGPKDGRAFDLMHSRLQLGMPRGPVHKYRRSLAS